MKKQKRRTLVKKADAAFSDYIRLRDGNVCQVCGSRENIQCGHLFSRTHYATRWDERNAMAQCRNCNFEHEHNFEKMRRAYVSKYGEEQLNEIYKLHNKVVKFKDYDLIQIEKACRLNADIQIVTNARAS